MSTWKVKFLQGHLFRFEMLESVPAIKAQDTVAP